MQKKTWAVLLIPLCLTACHQTTYRSTAKDEILTGSYIDPTKTRFPLADYSQSVDKWIPPDSADYTIPVIDSATQQRYFLLHGQMTMYLTGPQHANASRWAMPMPFRLVSR